MPLIDLTLQLTHRMPVYPGDPEVDIIEVHTLANQGWRLRTLTFTTHLGTHVNVPSHMVADGKTLDDYPLERFIGKSIVFGGQAKWDKNTGLIFSQHTIDHIIADQLIAHPPKFVGLSSEFEFDIELEKKLLEHGILSFENLANTEKLPESFIFFGIPLSIPGADGSPIRAFAEVPST